MGYVFTHYNANIKGILGKMEKKISTFWIRLYMDNVFIFIFFSFIFFMSIQQNRYHTALYNLLFHCTWVSRSSL